MADDERGAEVVRRYKKLVDDSFQFRDRWERMASILAPSRMGIVTKYAKGEKQTRELYDSTTPMAAELMAQFIAGTVINPSTRWVGFRLADPTLNRLDAVREWLEECRDRYLRQLSNSFFYAEGPESFIDFVGFGTSCLFQEEAPQPTNRTIQGFRGFHVRAERTGRYVIQEGGDGRVDTIMKEREFTARVCNDLWGAPGYGYALPENIQNALKEKQLDKPFKILHAIYPRPTAERGGYGSKGMPWASCWIEMDSKQIIKESGYRIFPAAVSRYSRTPDEVYGRGRGDIAFPDSWTLNTTKRMGLEDFALKVRPPVMQSHNSVIGTLRLVPGGPTAINTHGKSIRDAIMPWETGSKPEVTALKEEELRKSIREIFFVEQIMQLLEMHKSEQTAFEFSNKLQLLFRLLGPVYGKIEFEHLKQVADVGFDTMYTAGAFPPPPPELPGGNHDVEATFENPLARAQRSGDAEAAMLLTQDLAPYSQMKPEMFDWIDSDEMTLGLMETRGFPASWTTNKKQVAILRQERQKQHAQEQQMAQVEQLAQVAGKAGPMLKMMGNR